MKEFFTKDKLLKSAFSTSCSKPKLVYNKYTGTKLFVPCGSCPSCLRRKHLMMSERVDNEIKQHKYSLFVTLTYDNKHLPVMFESSKFMLDNDLDNIVYAVNPRTNNHLYVSNRADVDSIVSYHKCPKIPITNYDDSYFARTTDYCISDPFPTLNKRDVILFLKRLRRNLYKLVPYNEKNKIRYFCSGEYGETYLRPHYHLIFFYDSDQVHSCFTERYKFTQTVNNKQRTIYTFPRTKGKYTYYTSDLIYKSWKMCSYDRCDASIVQGSAANYVSGYVTDIAYLPPLLSHKSIRPFFLCSKNPIIGSYKTNETKIFQKFLDCEVIEEIPESPSSPSRLVQFPLSYINKYFKKFVGFSGEVSPRQLSVFCNVFSEYQQEVLKDPSLTVSQFVLSLIEQPNKDSSDPLVQLSCTVSCKGISILQNSGALDHDFNFCLVQNRSFLRSLIKNILFIREHLRSTYSVDDYISDFVQFHSKLALCSLAKFYSQQELLSSLDNNGVSVSVPFYDNFKLLPASMTESEWFSINPRIPFVSEGNCVSYFPTNFESFGFSYSDIYDDNGELRYTLKCKSFFREYLSKYNTLYDTNCKSFMLKSKFTRKCNSYKNKGLSI